MNLFRCNTKDGGYGWATDVDVHDSGLYLIICGKRPPKLSSESGLADAALSREDDDLVSHGTDALTDERQRRIGSLWCIGGANLLVWTAVACIRFAGELGLCALSSC